MPFRVNFFLPKNFSKVKREVVKENLKKFLLARD